MIQWKQCFGKGGYGLGRIIDRLILKNSKSSRSGSLLQRYHRLHSHLIPLLYFSLHAPMLEHLMMRGIRTNMCCRWKSTGRKKRSFLPVHDFNRKGEAIGELIGVTLLIGPLVGTDSDIKNKRKDLLLKIPGIPRYWPDDAPVERGQIITIGRIDHRWVYRYQRHGAAFGKTAYEILENNKIVWLSGLLWFPVILRMRTMQWK